MMRRCNDDTVASQGQCTGTFRDVEGQLLQREWLNSNLNFDNIFQAFLALFVTVTLDGAHRECDQCHRHSSGTVTVFHKYK
jgi:hypothetical protein